MTSDTHRPNPALPWEAYWITVALLCVTGCATSPSRDPGVALSSSALLDPGSTYDLTIYVIKTGDTLNDIGRQFGLTLAELRRLNPQLGTTPIRVGQAIRVRQQRRAVRARL